MSEVQPSVLEMPMQSPETAPVGIAENQEPANITVMDRMLGSRLGKGFTTLVAAASFGGNAAPALAGASANVSGAPVVTELNSSATVRIAGSSMSESSFSKVSVLGNHRVVSKAKIHKLEEQGRCKVIDGKKHKIWTQGHNEAGLPYGRDTRTSEFCNDGHGHWYRAKCGNRASFWMPKKVVSGRVLWVNNFDNVSLKVTAKSNAKAEADCKTENTFAKAYGQGSGSATVTMKLRNAMKTEAKMSSVISSEKAKAEAKAQSKASAKATAICVEITPTTPPPPTTTVTPKNGTQGAGEGTNTNTTPDNTGVGGPGAGGQPGNPTTGEVCRNTAGDITTGQSDQFGYCV